jgi:sec-independent protein translocase protein TatA
VVSRFGDNSGRLGHFALAGAGGFMEFPIHWLIILVVVLILFGGRKIPELMRGLGEGVRGFKEGMSGSSQSQAAQPPAQTTPPADKSTEEKK